MNAYAELLARAVEQLTEAIEADTLSSENENCTHSREYYIALQELNARLREYRAFFPKMTKR